MHRCEPYVYSQMIAGSHAPAHGEAKDSWLTGTAAWNYVAITQWILGLRPTYAGLAIDPCIPREWPSFCVTRRFRDALYEIEVRSPDRVCRGVSSIIVDGEQISNQVLPILESGKTHRAVVTLG